MNSLASSPTHMTMTQERSKSAQIGANIHTRSLTMKMDPIEKRWMSPKLPQQMKMHQMQMANARTTAHE
jgi:hypothetical protein